MLKLYKFFWDCGRMGEMEGLFVADDKIVADTIGKELYFGEVLGKHSEIYGTLKKKDLTIISEDQEKINWLADTVQSYSISGWNPLDFTNEEDTYEDEE